MGAGLKIYKVYEGNILGIAFEVNNVKKTKGPDISKQVMPSFCSAAS